MHALMKIKCYTHSYDYLAIEPYEDNGAGVVEIYVITHLVEWNQLVRDQWCQEDFVQLDERNNTQSQD